MMQLPTQVPEPADQQHSSSTSTASQPFIHPLSGLLLMVVDALWTIPDMAAFAWIVTIPACFAAVAIPVYLVQKFMGKDPGGKAAAIAAVLGVLAAIPTPVTGTVVGAIVLALSGLRSLGGRR